jgi:hypothetical protein
MLSKARGFEMTDKTRHNLQDFILGLDAKEVSVDDVLLAFWDDWDKLRDQETKLRALIEEKKQQKANLHRREREAFYEYELHPLGKDLSKLKAIPLKRRQMVMVAFNQLFLAGKVKRIMGRPDLGSEYDTARTFEEYKAWRIKDCEECITSAKEIIASGQGGSFEKCWLGNLQDYLEGYQQTEILERRKLDNELLRAFKPLGELICVGALAEDVWPTKIVRVHEPKYRQGVLPGWLYGPCREYSTAVPC